MSSPSALHTPEKITLMRSMIPYLLDNGATPISVLARHFDADEATVRKIVRFFGLAGVPGETSTYQHEDLFDIDWDALEERDEAVLIRTVVVHETPQFSHREIAAFIAGLQYLRSIPNFINDLEITALMRKLADATGIPSVPVDIALPTERPELSALHHAAQDQALAEFDYITRSGNRSSRRVFPIQLESLDETWYLRGWCTDRMDERLFRIDRMSDIRVSRDERLAAERAQTVARTLGTSQPGWRLSAEDAAFRIVVSAPNERMGRLRLFEPEVHDGRATIMLADLSRAWDVAASSPGHVEVLEPALARDAVAQWASLALANYDE